MVSFVLVNLENVFTNNKIIIDAYDNGRILRLYFSSNLKCNCNFVIVENVLVFSKQNV